MTNPIAMGTLRAQIVVYICYYIVVYVCVGGVYLLEVIRAPLRNDQFQVWNGKWSEFSWNFLSCQKVKKLSEY